MTYNVKTGKEKNTIWITMIRHGGSGHEVQESWLYLSNVTPCSSCVSPLSRGVTLFNFAGYVLLASQSPYPIIGCSVANYRPHLSHFWANV